MLRRSVALVPLWLSVLGFTGACTQEDETTPGAPCSAPHRVVGERCLAPGVQDDGCPAGTLRVETLGLDDGSCQAPGIPAGACAEGFAHDGDAGCEPVLPASPCLPGHMAVPGDAECHAVMVCASGQWGDIPVEPSGQYVDASYSGSDGDGTMSRPWTSVQDAVDAAAPGALIAIAAGSYGGVHVAGKPVRLWGVCPERVAIAGTDLAALRIDAGASGSEVRGLALVGPSIGLLLSGSENVVLDRVWLHDLGDRGINLQPTFGATSLRVVDSLVEASSAFGIFVAGATLDVEATVVRRTAPAAGSAGFGRGINVGTPCIGDDCDIAARPTATIRRSVIEDSYDVGLYLSGGDLLVEASVVRRTLPQASDQLSGRGVEIALACSNATCDSSSISNATVRGSLVEQNHGDGLHVAGSEAIVETTVVRDTLPSPLADESNSGISVDFGCLGSACAQASFGALRVTQSLIERSNEYGLFVAGAEATIEATVVRQTELSPDEEPSAVGVNVQSCAPADGCPTRVRGSANLHASKIENNHQIGIYVSASDAVVEGTLVRNTLPSPMGAFPGLGMFLNLACRDGTCDPATPAVVTVTQSEIAESFGVGVFVASSEAILESTVVRAIEPYDETLGDGVVVFASIADARATLDHTLVADAARAGVSSFGGFAALGFNAIRCAGFDINGETYEQRAFAFDDRGGNRCGCPATDGDCQAVASGLMPPALAHP